MHLAAARPGRLAREHENLWAAHQHLDTEDGPMTRPARRTIRPFLPAVAVIGALGLAACGGEEPPPPTSSAVTGSEASETSPESLDKPEQQQVDAETAKAALPTVEDMPDDEWLVDISTFSDDPITYDPAVCADVELGSQEARTFDDEHRTVNEPARFSKSLGNYNNLITATYVESFDAPYPTAFFDAAGEHVTDCGTYTWTKGGSSSTRHVQAISVPQLGDRSFGLRLTSDGGDDYTDRLYVRSGHNLITVMMLSTDEHYDGELMTQYAQGILDELNAAG